MTNKCWDMVATIYISGPFLSQSSHSEPQQPRSCLWVSTLIASDSLRNSRAGSRTIYQHGTDVNVLFERRVAVVDTQSQQCSRNKWWIDTTSCAGANGGRTGALLSKNIDRTVKRSLHAFFSDYVRSLGWCTVQRQVPSIKFT
jgi:hypothetical protein